MKKVILTALAAVGMMTAQAQDAYMAPSFGDNWSIVSLQRHYKHMCFLQM